MKTELLNHPDLAQRKGRTCPQSAGLQGQTGQPAANRVCALKGKIGMDIQREIIDRVIYIGDFN